ncbi:MAG TPA: ATP-binding protein [Steroidobacteraceae bacterium]|jgi:signal transduction histidine kinase|nr:ATP-binding protein [Steroidobacteraceae bacterium]
MPDSSESSRINQPQVGLASWLGGGSVFVVLLAVATMAVACGVLLNRQIQQQALVRTQLAVATARELLRRAGEDALSNARVLAERPTLQRLAENPTSGGLEPFLQRYNESTGIDVSALLQDNTAIAQSGTAIDWAEIATAIQEQGERFLLAPKQGGDIIWGAAALLPGTSIRAVTLKLTSPAELASLSQQVGASLSAVNFATYHAPPDDPMTPLHTQALTTSGGAAAGRLPKHGDFAATSVIAAQTGEVIGLLDARLPSSEFSAATRNFEWILATVAIVVAGIAGLLGVLYGRWLAQPVVALREFADRMGRGDFTAAIPAVAPLEVGVLGRSLDEMRRNLVNLTETLRQREAEAQTVLNGVVEGVYAVDMDRRIRYANAQVARLLDRPQSEILGQFCGDVLQPRPHNGERPCERNCPILAARESSQSDARELLCLRSGVVRSTIIQSAPPVHGMQVQILRDETDLEAARRARDSVLGNISHEFRTPLAAQLASIELLRDGLKDMPPEAQQELLSNVERGVLRLMRLIDNLLESVRLEAGQSSIRQQPVDLLDVVVDSRDLIAPLLRQRQLSVSIDEAGIGAIVRGDSQRLGQVFVNLLANAAKFAPEASMIRVGGQRMGSTVEVWVEDEGPGIPEGSSTAIFERFQRGTDFEPDAPGLGLGLWITKSIIERHGGRIRMERTAQQRTRFILSLPQERED